VLAAALCHGVWNAAAKAAGGDDRSALFAALLVSALWLKLALWFGWGMAGRWGLAEWAVSVPARLSMSAACWRCSPGRTSWPGWPVHRASRWVGRHSYAAPADQARCAQH